MSIRELSTTGGRDGYERRRYIMIKAIWDSFKNASFTVKLIYLYTALLPAASGLLFVTRGFQKMHLADLVFIFILLSWLSDRNNIIRISFHKYHRPLYFMLAMLLIATLLSIINSINLFHSAIDWIGLTYLVLLFVIIISAIDTRGKFIGLLAAYSIGAVTAALIGLGSLTLYLLKGDLGNNPLLMLANYQASLLSLPRIKVFYSTPSFFASFEHVGLIALFSIYFLTKKISSLSEKRLILVSVIAILASLSQTGSRMIAGSVAALFIISFLFEGKIFTILRYILFTITTLILIFVICASIWMIYPISINANHPTRDLIVHINYAYSYHAICNIYALSMFRKHPIFGVGIGTFMDNYPSYINKDIEMITADRYGVSLGEAIDPHNTFTGALAEWGIAGFAVMIAMFVYLFKVLISGTADSVRMVMLAGFVGLILNAFFIDSMMLRHFWLFMAFIVIFDNIRRKDAEGIVRLKKGSL